jgi:hypothetical protein
MEESKDIQDPKDYRDNHYAFKTDLMVPCMGMKRFTSHKRRPTTIRTSTTWSNGMI